MPKPKKPWQYAVSKYSAAEVRDGVRCAKCDAGKGERCWTIEEEARPLRGCHWQRHRDYERIKGVRPLRRSQGMTTRFECPVCGGPHARADHQEAA